MLRGGTARLVFKIQNVSSAVQSCNTNPIRIIAAIFISILGQTTLGSDVFRFHPFQSIV